MPHQRFLSIRRSMITSVVTCCSILILSTLLYDHQANAFTVTNSYKYKRPIQAPIKRLSTKPLLYASSSENNSSPTFDHENNTADTGTGDSFSLSFDKSLHKNRILKRCLLAILVYMGVGVVSFSRIFEKWPIVDSLYFSVVTFTTVGYGDLVPTTEAGKLFATIYSFAGISIVGALLGYVGGTIVEAEQRAVQRSRFAARNAMVAVFDPRKKRRGVATRRVKIPSVLQKRNDLRGDTISDEDGSELNVPNNTRQIIPGMGMLQKIASRLFAISIKDDESKSLMRQVIDTLASIAQSRIINVFVPFISLALYIGKREGWTPITSMYYAIATASTVGYGDIAPASRSMRLLSLVFIPLAVISLGEILAVISGYFIRKETNRAEREFMDRRMTLADLEAMDINNDGEVDLFEWLTFMLVSMKQVDRDMMDNLKALFESLDKTNSNSIQTEDLILLAQQNTGPWSARGNGKMK